jgi:FKBP-type peptidyl-prolyl cis-trans isomerase
MGIGSLNRFLNLAVKYTGKLENGTVFERKGSSEEPFEFIASEGIGNYYKVWTNQC